MTYDVIARARRARRRRRLRLAAVIVAFGSIAAGAAVLAAMPQSTSPGDHTVVVAPNGHPGATESVGGQAEPGTSAPLPSDLTWTTLAGLSLPVSASAGPTDIAGGLARGFAHTRAGAVLAAVHLAARVAPQVGPAVFGPTLHDQVVGPAAAALAEQVQAQYQQLCDQAHLGYGPPVGTLSAALAGYRIELYTDTTVTVRVMTRTDQPGTAPLYAAAVIQLTWTGSDWALQAPTGGVWDQAMTLVDPTNLGMYNSFGGGR